MIFKLQKLDNNKIQGGAEVTLGLWNWIKMVKIHNMKKINLWNFRWQESILEKLCRKITSHILVCLSICLCVYSIAHEMHYNTGWTRSNTGSLKLNKKGRNSEFEKKIIYEILGDRNLFWKNYVEKLPAIYLSVYLFVCVHVLFCVFL